MGGRTAGGRQAAACGDPGVHPGGREDEEEEGGQAPSAAAPLTHLPVTLSLLLSHYGPVRFCGSDATSAHPPLLPLRSGSGSQQAQAPGRGVAPAEPEAVRQQLLRVEELDRAEPGAGAEVRAVGERDVEAEGEGLPRRGPREGAWSSQRVRSRGQSRAQAGASEWVGRCAGWAGVSAARWKAGQMADKYVVQIADKNSIQAPMSSMASSSYSNGSGNIAEVFTNGIEQASHNMCIVYRQGVDVNGYAKVKASARPDAAAALPGGPPTPGAHGPPVLRPALRWPAAPPASLPHLERCPGGHAPLAAGLLAALCPAPDPRQQHQRAPA
ncbi:hypothetical protein HaLaN_19172, partial [Haematococcus lacustris]